MKPAQKRATEAKATPFLQIYQCVDQAGILGVGRGFRVGWLLPNGLLVTHNPRATPFFSGALGAQWPLLEAATMPDAIFPYVRR